MVRMAGKFPVAINLSFWLVLEVIHFLKGCPSLS
jgi:hypothetical protein